MVIEVMHDEQGHRRLFEGFLREYEARRARVTSEPGLRMKMHEARLVEAELVAELPWPVVFLREEKTTP